MSLRFPFPFPEENEITVKYFKNNSFCFFPTSNSGTLANPYKVVYHENIFRTKILPVLFIPLIIIEPPK